MKIGRKIYYLKTNGNILISTGECQGDVRETSIDEDFKMYMALKGLEQSAVGVFQLEYGQLADKFNDCTGYYIDITKNPIDANAIVFSFTTPEATLDQVKQAKYTELSQACQNAITGGFTSTAYQNTAKMYDSTLEDQANITGNALSAVSKISGVAACANDKFYYHARSEDFTEWTAEECLQLARDFKSFKEQQLIKNKELQAYVSTLNTVEDVQKVTWNTVIPSNTTTA
ncbi:hypothetical protein ACJDT4_00330 [Clostridium neuense]|uniref:DUF4376 domain-containing protein n=1 Tax=Clostridium neuense TaxID=1728934 RepID=A0ABW8T930_9CLOT